MLFVHNGLSLSPIAIHCVKRTAGFNTSEHANSGKDARSDFGQSGISSKSNETCFKEGGAGRRPVLDVIITKVTIGRLSSSHEIRKIVFVRMEAISSNLSSLKMNTRKQMTSEGFKDRVSVFPFHCVIYTEAHGNHMDVNDSRVDQSESMRNRGAERSGTDFMDKRKQQKTCQVMCEGVSTVTTNKDA